MAKLQQADCHLLTSRVNKLMSKEIANRQIHLIARPQGAPSVDHFNLHVGSVPELKEGEILVRPLYLSVDPYMRGRMGGRPSMHLPFPLNQSASGDGVGRVVESKHADFQVGDTVCGFLEWADYCALAGSALRKFDPLEVSPREVLSVLGMPAMTGYFGLLEIGRPKAGEMVVVSGAAGAVGMMVGQIAKIKGCRVVGITGSDAKVNYLVKELGFDAAVNYKNPQWPRALGEACPAINIYFDNVGGEITDEVMKRISQNARVVLCGQISSSNLQQPDIGPRNFRHLIVKSAMARGFRVLPDYLHRFPEGRDQLYLWLREKKIKPCETIVHGLENIPKALLGLFSGDNLGKQLVQVE